MLLHKQKVSRAGLLVVYYERVLCGHIEARYALGWRCFGIYTFRKRANRDTTPWLNCPSVALYLTFYKCMYGTM